MLMPLILLTLVGCPSEPRIGAINGSADRWPYWPVAMRLHPLTRVVIDPTTNSPMIEARVEFTDQDGVTARSVGEIHLILRAAGGSHPLNEWEIDLRESDTNANHFDIVTATYLFKLNTTELELPPRVVLIARFKSTDGWEQTAEHEMRIGDGAG
jgi:hypothetical protein